MYVLRRWINVLNLLLLAVFSGLAEPRRRPLVRAPRDAELTGEHLIVADKSLSSQEFHQLLTRISNGATVRSYVENVGKVITATLSPYAREMVSCFSHSRVSPRFFAPLLRSCIQYTIWQRTSAKLCSEPNLHV
jgi:hypothetical protein